MATKTKAAAAAQEYLHGIQVILSADGARFIGVPATAVIGLVATAKDADEATFPLNTPVRIDNLTYAIGKAGTQGTLRRCLEAFSKITRPVCIVVRVAEGATPEETTSNVIGTTTEDSVLTGLQALRIASQTLTIKPRILGAPGLDNQEVITEMVSVAKSLRAFVYAANQGKKLEDAFTYRNNFSAKELMLIDGDFTNWNVITNQTDVIWATAIAMALRAYIDTTYGWHRSLSNIPVDGVTGIALPRSWDLQDATTDANKLNEKHITTLINFNGFRFWGSRTTSDDTNYKFEVDTRVEQVLADMLAEASFTVVDGVMNANNIADVVQNHRATLKLLKRGGYLLGGDCWYAPELNTEAELANGRYVISHDYTVPPPMEQGKLLLTKTTRYLVDMNEQIVQLLG